MKTVKKLLALVIAAVMVMAMGTAAFAETAGTPTTDTQIKITGLEDVAAVDFYQVLEWKGNEIIDSTNAGKYYGGWGFAAPFAGNVLSKLKDNNDQAFATEADAIRFIVGNQDAKPPVAMNLTAEIAGELADLATDSYKKAGTLSSDGSEATLDIGGNSGNTLGLYMALITTNDASDYLYNPVFVSADYSTSNGTDSWIVDSSATYSNQAAAKMSKEFIDKQGEKDNGTSYDLDWKSVRPGEIVHFTVTSSIPGYGPVYQTPHFVVKDQLTAMTLKSGTVELVKPTGLTKGTGTADETATNADYFITENPDGDGYTITFTQKYLKTVNAPKDVEIAYDAVVNDDVEQNINEKENEVWIEYSHKPTDESDYDYKKDDTIHYTFSIDAKTLIGDESVMGKSGSEIIKIAVDADGNPIYSEKVWSAVSPTNYQESPLEGATFKLYKASPTAPTSTSPLSAATMGEEYKDVDGNTLSLSSDANGRINIEGLDGGTYFLVEESAPTGYIKDQDPVRIDIVPEYEEIEVTKYTNGTDWKSPTDDGFNAAVYKDKVTYKMDVLKKVTIYVDGVEGAVHTFMHDSTKKSTWIKESSKELPSSIVNTKGVELPSTGGMGTKIFYIVGTILVLGAGIILISRRRMGVN